MSSGSISRLGKRFKIRTVNSLLSLSVNAVVANIQRFTADLEFIRCLPYHIKDVIVKKITTRTDKWKDYCEFNLILESIIHPYLKRIDLSAANITDETLKILEKCPNLEEVYLSKRLTENSFITSEGFISFFKHVPKLQKLDVSNCQAFDDKAMSSLGLCCPHIEEINASCCDFIGDHGLIEFAKGVQNLKRIQVCHTKVGNSGITALVEKQGENLTELRFDYCRAQGDIFIIVPQNCPNLEIWTFNGCTVTEDTLQQCNELLLSNKKLKQIFWTVPW